MRKLSPVERVLLGVRLDGRTVADCWLWEGHRNSYGYGHLTHPGSKTVMVHRIVYEALVGPIPEGLDIDHLCRQRNCVNPRHLEPVTKWENTLRGDNFMATLASQTHCKRGHEFTEENTRLKNGARMCRACSRLASRRHDAKRRGNRPIYEHGKRSSYVKGCRCDLCRAASFDYMREYRLRKVEAA